MEHLTPLAKGGRHAPANIVAACAYCNCQKWQKDEGTELRIYPFIERTAEHLEIWDVARTFRIDDAHIQKYVREGVIAPVSIWRKNCKTPLFTQDAIDNLKKEREYLDAISLKRSGGTI